jgi:hypothetical protein
MGKLSLALGLGVGYVLGTQAGRARYEQIKQAAAGLMERPEVQQAMEKARSAAPAPLQDSISKLSSRASGRQSAGAGTADVEATVISDDLGTPTPPASGPGGSGPVDTALPDPLIPPAKSNGNPTGSS